MFTNWKRLYMLAEERLKNQGEYIRETSKDKKAYDNIMDNLNFILNKHGEYNINIYFSNSQLYYIAETWRPSAEENNYTIELCTYKLEEIPIRTSPIAELSANLVLNNCNKEKIAYIESIDTMRELRNGHGSQILKRFIYIVKNTSINTIKGELFNSTPIGVENLKKFYINNGFNVHGGKFSMVMRELKPNYNKD